MFQGFFLPATRDVETLLPSTTRLAYRISYVKDCFCFVMLCFSVLSARIKSNGIQRLRLILSPETTSAPGGNK